MSAVTVLRDLVGACDTAREAKKIIGNREMFVNGKAVKNPKAPVGFMDVITVPKMNLAFRMLLTDKGKLTIVAIDEAETSFVICKILDKTIVKGGKFQLNLSGGRNILLEKNDYKCGDSIKVAFENQAILEHYPMAAGNTALVTDGSHAGCVKAVKEVQIIKGTGRNIVLFTDGTETVTDNIIMIGGAAPAIKLPEVSE
jgi:small subunit ribosomal protein S4e